jgi:phytanoyl-CoA hydroxylase
VSEDPRSLELRAAEPAPGIDLEAVLSRYREHGFARVGRVFDEARLAPLRERAEAIMLGQVAYPGLFFQHDTTTGRYEDLEYKKGYIGPSRHYRKIEKLEKDPLFWRLVCHPLFESIARAWIPGEIAIYRAVLFNKPALGGTVLPWHQDGGSYWGLDRNPTLQIWTALDSAPIDSGCLEVIPGSHRDGLATPLGGVIPAHVLALRDIERERTHVPAEAGEVVLIHNHLWHGSGVNRTAQPRRGVTICYMSAETRCLRKKRSPRQFVRVFDRERKQANE